MLKVLQKMAYISSHLLCKCLITANGCLPSKHLCTSDTMQWMVTLMCSGQ